MEALTTQASAGCARQALRRVAAVAAVLVLGGTLHAMRWTAILVQ